MDKGFGRRERGKKTVFLAVLVLILAWTAIGAGRIEDKPQPRILLSNDDGVDAPGLAVLFERLSKFALVTVVAPAENQSGVGHALTFPSPFVVRKREKQGSRWFAVEAVPATCVKLGLETLLEQKPDIVVSGINPGDNPGVMTFSSGTVACGREAAFKGVPAVAVNLERGSVMDYEGAADFAAGLVKEVCDCGLPPGTYLNVNYPALPRESVKGVLVVPQDPRPFPDYTYRRYSLEGILYLFYDFRNIEPGPEKTDVWAVRNGYIAVTPLRIDQTDGNAAAALEEWETIKRKAEKRE